jgi:N-methylhydantoinase B
VASAAVEHEILHARLVGVVREMQHALFRTGYSTIIRESQDASCAITDPEGRVVAQHTVLPLHLGAFPACVAGILDSYPRREMREGDAFLINHPYRGGSPHANDAAVVVPVFHGGEPVAFCGSIAHKSDIGGMVPGSGSGQAREVFQEGLLIPAVRLQRAGEPVPETAAIVAANSRTPELVLGDIAGQLGSARLGERRCGELLRRYGAEGMASAVDRILALTERRVRAAVAAWPDGVYQGESFLDGDSEGGVAGPPHRVHVSVTVAGDRIHFDFTGSDPQTAGPCNIRPPLVRAACYYCLKCLIDPQLPSNDGLARVVETRFRPGSILDPVAPAPVNAYIAAAQAVAEAVLLALGPVAGARRIAGSSGTGAIALGAAGGGPGFVQYELFGGGLGARAGRDGVSATSVHVGNSRITPIEIVESEFPVRVRRFDLLAGSGGAGRRRGGLGFVREYELLAEARLSVRLDRHDVAPCGLEGGEPGRRGAVRINPGTAEERRLPARVGDVRLHRGDVLRIERPGGGGFGPAAEREPEAVRRDREEGYSL